MKPPVPSAGCLTGAAAWRPGRAGFVRGLWLLRPLRGDSMVSLPEGDAVCGAGEFMGVLRDGGGWAGPGRGNWD